MEISFNTLLTLAKVAKDPEAEKALTHYQSMTQYTQDGLKLRVLMIRNSYQVVLSTR